MRKGWVDTSLDDVCQFKGGTGFKEHLQGKKSGLYPFIKVSDMTLEGNEKFIINSNNWIDESDLKEMGVNLMPLNSVVFAKVGAALKLNKRRILTRATAIDNNMMAAMPDIKKIDPEYLYYFMLTQDLGRFCQESAVPSVNQQHMSEIFIPLPPLAEQKKIAAILRTWDDAIEKQDKIVASLQKKRKALLGKLLLKQQTNKPLKYFAKPVAREVDKPTSAYHALGLRSHCKGTFQRFIKDAATVAMETLYQVKENDLIVNITFAWEGAIALVKKDDEHCLVSHRFPTYEIDTSKALPQFIRHVVQTKKFIESLGIISPGGAGRNRVLSKKDFLELKIWLPDLSTQAHIADIISTLELEIETATALLEKFKTQKRGLMQKLLTGAWPVQTSDKEAA